MEIVPVILSGGAGARLWPLSRPACPKPFVALPDGTVPAAAAYARAARLRGVRHVVTVTNRDFLFLSADAYAAAGAPARESLFLLEPAGRGTAAAVALAALHAAREHGGETVLLVLPADHIIGDEPAFATAVQRAAELARQGRIVTFGVAPDRPETGFGYIEVAGEDVLRFVEKPDAAAAAAYVADDRHRWNSGMFCFAAAAKLRAMELHCPAILDGAARALGAAVPGHAGAHRTLEVAAGAYLATPAAALDRAVMEKAGNLACVPLDCGWSDVGAWPAVAALIAPDGDGNRVAGDVVLDAAAGCLVIAGGRRVALVGVDDLVVVDTPGALLVAHKDSAQDIGRLRERLTAGGPPR
jgi:mannose-1-phosphate guanylyltransferase